MMTLYAIVGLVVALAVSIWLAMRAARREGEATAKIVTLTDGKDKEREADEILARPVPDPDSVLSWLRNDRPKG